MKTISIRLLLLLILLAACIFGPVSSSDADLLWDTGMATAFAFAVIRLTGRAPIFLPLAIVAVTAAFPFVILCEIVRPFQVSWWASVSHVASNLNQHHFLHGFELLIPAAFATAVVAIFGRRVGQGYAFKRDLRG